MSTKVARLVKNGKDGEDDVNVSGQAKKDGEDGNFYGESRSAKVSRRSDGKDGKDNVNGRAKKDGMDGESRSAKVTRRSDGKDIFRCQNKTKQTPFFRNFKVQIITVFTTKSVIVVSN